jgi:Fic family protein
MHEQLLQKGRGAEKQPGQFRRSQNWLGGTRPGNARFVPPPPDVVPDAMSALEAFLNDTTASYPVLVVAAMAHVQFETIHPFLDGNGRIGRLLIPLLLHQAGILQEPLLYLSLYFKQHRDEYYRLLDEVRATGDWEAWLDFFLEGVETTSAGAVDTAQRLAALVKRDQAHVQARGGRSVATLLRMLQVLHERPIVTINEVVRRTGVSFPTAAKGMATLVDQGIAREVTGLRRNRVFSYAQYLALLGEGTEPLQR